MSPSAPGPHPVDASLHLLADHLFHARVTGQLEASLLHVGGIDGDGFELATAPLDGQHPSSLLLGTDAPADWWAVGLVTGGWAFPLAERTAPERRRVRVEVVTLVSRSGEIVHRTWCEDAALDDRLRGQAPTGEQVDLLHRSLGLPTPPPPAPAATFWSLEWLGAVLNTDPAPTDWPAVLGRHPAVRLLDAHRVLVDRDALEVVDAFHRVCSWERLRRLAADGRYDVPDLDAPDAAWLDVGSFSRWLLSRRPPLTEVRRMVSEHVPPALDRRIAAFLDALEVPERHWPDTAGSDGRAA